MKLCKCGYLGDPELACSKAPLCAADYQNKISGPLLDRIDLHIEMPMINTIELLKKEEGESTAKVASRVKTARELSRSRLASLHGKRANINASLSGDELDAIAKPDAKGMALLEQAMRNLKLSMRAYTRILRVARTIADLEQSGGVQSQHIAEALSYRQMHHNRTLRKIMN